MGKKRNVKKGEKQEKMDLSICIFVAFFFAFSFFFASILLFVAFFLLFFWLFAWKKAKKKQNKSKTKAKKKSKKQNKCKKCKWTSPFFSFFFFCFLSFLFFSSFFLFYFAFVFFAFCWFAFWFFLFLFFFPSFKKVRISGGLADIIVGILSGQIARISVETSPNQCSHRNHQFREICQFWDLSVRNLGSVNCIYIYMYIIHIISGWWFGTFFIFPYIGNNHPN